MEGPSSEGIDPGGVINKAEKVRRHVMLLKRF